MRADGRRLAATASVGAVLLLLLAAGSGRPQAERAGGGSIAPTASGSDPTSVPAGDERSASAARPAPFVFSTSGFEFAEAEARLDSIRITYGQGTPTEKVPVHRGPEGAYIGLGDLGRIGGQGFQWDPESWRGTVRIDTVSVVFTVDSPIAWVDGTPVQMPAPVRYRAEEVLLPIGVLGGVVSPLLGSRCVWNPLNGELRLSAAPPWLDTVALSGSEFSASLQIAPIAAGSLRLRWDPMGTLYVEGRGPHLRPGTEASIGRTEGVGIAAAQGTPRGFEVALRLDPRWSGVRLREDRGERTVWVDLTARDREVYDGKYRPLAYWSPPRHPRAPGGGAGRTILIEVAPPPPSAGLQGDCLVGLAQALRRTLEMEFGHTVVPVEDRGETSQFRSPAGLPETPGAPDGDCWIGLRLESHKPGTDGEFGLTVARPAPRREALGLGALQVQAEAVPDEPRDAMQAKDGFEEIPPWGQVARLDQAASARLAHVIADHLDYRWADRPVRIHERPSRIFRGLGMPAVLVYPAAANDDGPLRALCDSTQTGELARNIAFAIDEFLLTRRGTEE